MRLKKVIIEDISSASPLKKEELQINWVSENVKLPSKPLYYIFEASAARKHLSLEKLRTYMQHMEEGKNTQMSAKHTSYVQSNMKVTISE